MDLQTASTVVPPWWEFLPSPGACRGEALSLMFDFSGLANASCEDPFGQPGVGGIADYTVTGDRARILGVGSIAPEVARALNPGKEYYGFRLALRLNRATGTGSCAGCSTTVDLVLNSIRAVRVGAVSGEDCYPITNQSIRWQCSSCPTPALSRTWGQVKSLFR